VKLANERNLKVGVKNKRPHRLLMRPLEVLIVRGSVIDLLLDLVGCLGETMAGGTHVLADTTHSVACGKRQGYDGKEAKYEEVFHSFKNAKNTDICRCEERPRSLKNTRNGGCGGWMSP